MSDESNVPAPADTENHDEKAVLSVKSVDPGNLDKQLEFHRVAANGDAVRLTIVNAQGDRESVVVLYGDVNGAFAVLGHDPAQGGGAAVTPEGEPGPTNEGENLERTPQNPEVEPVAPGVEPTDAPEATAGDNTPTTTDPEGDTSRQNAPQPPAPEGTEGPNTTTNPGTDQPGGESQTETPAASDEGAKAEPTPEPAADASEKPLYVYAGDDPSYAVPDTYTPSGLVTPGGKVLYHFSGDSAGEPASGAVDGQIGVYADDVVPQAS